MDGVRQPIDCLIDQKIHIAAASHFERILPRIAQRRRRGISPATSVILIQGHDPRRDRHIAAQGILGPRAVKGGVDYVAAHVGGAHGEAHQAARWYNTAAFGPLDDC
jgi:hypothetical protein